MREEGQVSHLLLDFNQSCIFHWNLTEKIQNHLFILHGDWTRRQRLPWSSFDCRKVLFIFCWKRRRRQLMGPAFVYKFDAIVAEWKFHPDDCRRCHGRPGQTSTPTCSELVNLDAGGLLGKLIIFSCQGAATMGGFSLECRPLPKIRHAPCTVCPFFLFLFWIFCNAHVPDVRVYQQLFSLCAGTQETSVTRRADCGRKGAL